MFLAFEGNKNRTWIQYPDMLQTQLYQRQGNFSKIFDSPMQKGCFRYETNKSALC